MSIAIREITVRQAESRICTDTATGESVILVSVFQGIFMGHGNLDTSPEFKSFLNHIPLGDSLRIYKKDNERTNPEWIRIIEEARVQNPHFDKWVERNYREEIDEEIEQIEAPEFGEPAGVYVPF